MVGQVSQHMWVRKLSTTIKENKQSMQRSIITRNVWAACLCWKCYIAFVLMLVHYLCYSLSIDSHAMFTVAILHLLTHITDSSIEMGFKQVSF